MMNVFLLFSQTTGIIKNSDGTPLDGVSVFLSDQQILLFTDKNGSFSSIKEIPNNSYIQFYKFGYSSKVIQYNTGEKLNVTLDKLHVDLDEVGVSESFSQLGNNKLMSIDRKSLESNFATSNSIVESVSKISGVDIISSGLGIQKLVVRGLSGMRIVTYLNGMKIENQQWANDHGIGFTDLGLYEVELIKGSSALKYGGEAVGGVLYFKDSPFVESDKLSGFLSTKFNNSQFLLANQIGLKWSKNNFYVNFYGQYSLSSDYRLPDNTYLYNSRFRNRSIKLSITNRQEKWQNILRYQYNGEQLGIPAHAHSNPEDINISDITLNSIDFNEDFKLTRPTQFVDNHLLIYENNYFTNISKFSFYFGHFSNNLKEYEKWTSAAFDMNLSNTHFRVNIRTKLNDFTMNVGSQKSILENKNQTLEKLIPDAKTNDLAFYTTLDYEKENYGLSSGIRYDNKNIISSEEGYNNSFNALSSSAGIYFAEKNHILRFTYSDAFRAPHFSELFSNGVHHGTSRYELGNSDLTLEKSHQFDFKYQWSNNHFGLVLNPFTQNIEDFISINPTDSFHQNNYRIYNYDQFKKVNLSGFEMNLHYHPHIIHNLHIEQSYSFIKTKNHDFNNVLALTPTNKIKTGVKLDFESQDLLFNIKTLSIYHVYSFEQNDVVENETPSNSYSVFNLGLNFQLFKTVSAVLTFNNLLNEEYVPHLSRVKEIAGGIPNPGRSFSFSLKYDI